MYNKKQHSHRLHCSCFGFLGNAFCVIGSDHCFVQKLPFFVGHVRDQQGEENMKLLDFLSQFGQLDLPTVQQVICGLIYLANLHDIDTVGTGRGDLNELAANIGACTVELMALQGCNDKYGDTFSAHPQGHQLHGEGLPGTTGAQDCHVRILVHRTVKDVYNDQGAVVLIDTQQNSIVIAHLVTGKGVATGGTACQQISLTPLKYLLFHIDQG